MNLFWLIVMVLSITIGIFSGHSEEMTAQILTSGKDAITLCLSLAGAYALWCGVLGVMQKAGLMEALARVMRPVMKLFPGVAGNAEAERAVAANLSANILGLGNAATPAGIDAMKHMRNLSGDSERASDAMCMFLVVNTSSIQLIPTTIISLRAAAGAAAPADILLPSLMATAISTAVAIICMKLWLKGERRYGKTSRGVRAAVGARGVVTRGISRRRGV